MTEREKHNRQMKAWRERNKEHCRAYRAEYYQRNKKELDAKCAKRKRLWYRSLSPAQRKKYLAGKAARLRRWYRNGGATVRYEYRKRTGQISTNLPKNVYWDKRYEIYYVQFGIGMKDVKFGRFDNLQDAEAKAKQIRASGIIAKPGGKRKYLPPDYK